jgi:TrkA domain protein
VDITRSTVPGVGTVHHVHTRGGRHFGVLVDTWGRRTLLIYDVRRPAADPDEPVVHIVIEPDEADELAEILQSRPMSDRLAEVERRLADLTGPGG